MTKMARRCAGWPRLGLAILEVGTVTRLPQAGNPRPRVHRVREVGGVINSMGFPNDGVEALLAALARAGAPDVALGINIGKGRDTPIERAAEDYVALLERVYPAAGYIAVNISSPNTMNLRQLQARAAIETLLRAVMASRNSQPGPRKPVWVKLAPDLTDAELDDAVGAVLDSGADGVIATNTTLSREGLPAYARELKGGLSGAPLTARADAAVRAVARRLDGALPVIGVGGIMTPDDAKARLDAGAALVQIYTGMIYAGPGLARDIGRALAAAPSAASNPSSAPSVR